jgi:hypothetical protein
MGCGGGAGSDRGGESEPPEQLAATHDSDSAASSATNATSIEAG